MNDSLFVLLSLMGRYVVFFLLPVAIGVTAIESHKVILIIITAVAIIFIVYIFTFDISFGVISSCTVFGHGFGSCRSCETFCIRDYILVLIQVITRVLISWILMLFIGCIFSINIYYFCRLISGISTFLMSSLLL